MFVIAMKRKNVSQYFTPLLTNAIVITVILFKEKIKLEFLTRSAYLKLFLFTLLHVSIYQLLVYNILGPIAHDVFSLWIHVFESPKCLCNYWTLDLQRYSA